MPPGSQASSSLGRFGPALSIDSEAVYCPHYPGGVIESTLAELAITLLFAWFVLRFLIRVIRHPSDLAERESEPGDFAGHLVTLRPRPRPGAGAVAIAEPDEDDDSASVPEPARAISTKDRGGDASRVA